MASNSLLECLVFAHSAAQNIKQQLPKNNTAPIVATWDASRVKPAKEVISISHNWDELRRFMWDYVGIVRTDVRLHKAKQRLQLLLQEIDDDYSQHRITSDLLELRNLADIADLIITSALQRKESRGLHYTLDYPDTQPLAQNTIISGKP